MKATLRRALTGVGAIALVGGTVLATGGNAFAAPPPSSLSNDPGATLGGIDFFNSAGVQITSGPLTSPTAAFGVAQTAPGSPPAHKSLTAFGYTPILGQTPAAWQGEQLSTSSPYPVTTPADLAGLPTTTPVWNGTTQFESLATYISDKPNTDTSTTDGYAGIYVFRIELSTGDYAKADLLIDTTAGTWTQEDGTFQLFPDTSTTTLGVTPPSPSVPSTVQTITATVADTTAGSTNVPAGTVAFFDNTTQIGTTQNLVGGTAHVTTTLALGSHPLTAVFTSSTPSAVANSTSALSTYVVANLDTPNVALSLTPTSGLAFSSIAMMATVTDSTTPATIPTGTVNFLDGGTQIGTAPLVSGTATFNDTAGFPFTAPGPDVHQITAVYVPTTGSPVAGGSSQAVPYSVTGAAACPNGEASTLCIDPQTVVTTVNAGTITITTPYNPSNPLVLPPMVLNQAGTMLSTSAAFGSTTGPNNDPTGTENEIFVTDTQAGNAPWTASVQSSDFVGINHTNIINGQNAGLTNLHVVTITGNNLQLGDVSTHDNPAASPALAPGVAGTLGIGGGPHAFANTSAAPGGTGGDGSVGFTGLFTLNAPTSTVADTYTATVTFTVG
jgi:Bacterial Ig-like domain (group 3)